MRVRRWFEVAAALGLAVGAAVLVAVLITPQGGGQRSLATSSKTAPSTTTTSPLPFAPGSVWNATLPPDAPVSPQSDTYVTELHDQVRRYGSWINTSSYSVPVYVVPAGEPKAPVTLDAGTPALAAAFRIGVPIPPGAKPAAGRDEHMVIWQPSRDTMWEFWHAHDVAGAWHARWGGVMTHVASNPGYFTDPPSWGATATSLPLLGGLIRISELYSGRIDHALALAIPHARAGHYVFPAQRSDGNDPSLTAIPEGTEFRLDPSLNIDSLNLTPLARAIAVAAQKYGIIVRDQSGAVSFYGEDPAPTGTSPYYGPQGFFGGLGPADVLRHFPWQDLQAIEPRPVGS